MVNGQKYNGVEMIYRDLVKKILHTEGDAKVILPGGTVLDILGTEHHLKDDKLFLVAGIIIDEDEDEEVTIVPVKEQISTKTLAEKIAAAGQNKKNT